MIASLVPYIAAYPLSAGFKPILELFFEASPKGSGTLDELTRAIDRLLDVGKAGGVQRPLTVWHSVEIGQLLAIGPKGLEATPDLGRWLIEEVYERNRPLNFLNDFNSLVSRGCRMAKAGLLNTVFVPILRDGRCVAHLALSSGQAGTFSAERMEFLTSVAGHLGLALRNVTLYQRAEERASRRGVLQEPNRKITENLDLPGVLDSIVHAAAEVLKADLSRIFLLDGHSQRLILRASHDKVLGRAGRRLSFKLGQGVIGKAAQAGEGVILPDVQKEPRWVATGWVRAFDLHSYTAEPLYRGGRVIGKLTLASRVVEQDGRRWWEARVADTGRGYLGGDHGPHLRPLLHHQGAGQGHRPRPLGFARGCRKPWGGRIWAENAAGGGGDVHRPPSV